ncbi:PAS domain S-box-containing protein [Singulisphaera sp. GP187]|uniref:PAS domain S-box protein n=1 Tax=Singulisphaera sp. GP187 TaxID=1882752 RepID=UPI00092CD93B|nr:PAS domain S-box protein [Singulisphaera sp. GP187]SIO40937.1 PAS domain S-box-containing protein [Singulisphaera sp. GP187]
MAADEDEDKLLRSVALQNANAIQIARQQAEKALIQAKESLERKTVELARLLAMMRATLESTTDGILVTDGNGNVTCYNEKYVAMWRVPRSVMDSPAPRSLREFSARQTKDPQQFLTVIDAIYTASPPESHDLLELADGRVIERSSRIQFVDGRNAGRVWSFRDVTERRRAEEARARLAAIVESSADAIISKDLDGRILSWNKGAERLYGYSAQEAVGMPITLIIPPDRQDEERAILERFRRGEQVEHFETVRVSKQGRWIDISLTISPIHDAKGQVVGVSKVARDITARKRSEAMLNGQKRVLELMAQGAGLAEVLDSLCRTVEGQSAEGMLASIQLVDRDGLHLRHGAAPSLPDSYNQAVDGIAIGPSVGSCGTAAFRREPVYVVDIATDPLWAKFAHVALGYGLRACWSHPILSSAGDVLGTFAMYYDRPRKPAPEDLGLVGIITRTAAIAIERKRAEEDLKKQSVRLRLLWEAAEVLLTTEEPGSMVRELFAKIAPQLGLDTYFNYMVTDLGDALRLESCVGISEEWVGSIARLEFGQNLCGTVALHRQPVVVVDIPQSTDPNTAFLRSCGIRVYTGIPLLVDGRLLGTLAFASRTRDRFDEDELEFLRTLTHYVTVAYERLRLVRELQDADRKKDDFIAMLGHELRNPLAPVRNGLQIMRLAVDDPTAIEQARGMMDRQLGHMVRLIDDLLDVSRISRNKMELRRARVALADVIDNATETARPAIEEAGQTLAISLPSKPIFLDADLTRLAQVLSNLLANSAKFAERGGRIELAAERTAHEVVIIVRDTGIGIPHSDLPRIFDMFSQVDRSMERATGGLGIGLALVKGLVEMHGGTVTAESGGQGMGSTFTVRLPALDTGSESEPALELGIPREPVLAAPSEDDRAAAQHHQRRILVVDDNQDSARTMARLLKLLGNEVHTAYDGHEAVTAAEGFRPEVVLMDVGMPGLNGYEATRQIRQQPWGQDTIVIALTGWGQDIDRLQSKAAGCDGHLVKPVDLPDLERLLENLADHGAAS